MGVRPGGRPRAWVPLLLVPLLPSAEDPEDAPSEADIVSFLGGAEVNESSERYRETRGGREPGGALELKNRLFEPNTKCLDHDLAVDNAWMHPCDGEPHQQWHWDEDGALHPLSDPSRCLEEDLGVFARANVWVRPCTGGDNQRWFWDGEKLKNHHSGTGKAEHVMCLDEDLAGGGYPGNVFVWPCHDSPNQFWYFSTAAEHMRIMEQAVDDYTGLDDVDEEPKEEKEDPMLERDEV
mmetsp:Transcript_16241/g.33892  ORF Transcript_16241/g.33892 Transcript_16241/m.33892 type:complete len:237 (+) Transcript_16241:2-712(+)